MVITQDYNQIKKKYATERERERNKDIGCKKESTQGRPGKEPVGTV